MTLTPAKHITVTFTDEELKALDTVADILGNLSDKLEEENSEYFCTPKVDDINDENLTDAYNLIRDISELNNTTLELP